MVEVDRNTLNCHWFLDPCKNSRSNEIYSFLTHHRHVCIRPNGKGVIETGPREGPWSKLQPQPVDTSSIDQEPLDRVSKEFLPATFDAAEEHRLEILEPSMMQHPRDVCIHRLAPVILEA